MLTVQQSKKLKKLIKDYADWQEADSWKGSKEPETMDDIEAKYKVAKKKMFNYINSLTDLGDKKSENQSSGT